MENKYIGYKIKLYPTDDQIKLFEEYFGLNRSVYNLALELQNQKYKEYKDGKTDKSLYTFFELNNKIRHIRKTDEKYSWMCNYNNETITITIKDLMYGFNRFFKGKNNKPKFKSKKRSGSKSFPIRSDRLLIEKDRVRISSIGYIFAKNIPEKILGYSNKDSKSYKYMNYSDARIYYNGLDYYLSFMICVNEDDKIITYNSNYNYKYNEDYQSKSNTEAIGIDLGCSYDNWIVMSDGYRKSLPDFSKEEKKLKRLMKKSSRQRKINKLQGERTNPTLDIKGPKEYLKSKNEEKTNKKINKYYKRITNKRKSAIYDACKHILDLKPEAVIMEDICVTDMINSVKKENIPKFAKEKYINKVYKHSLYDVKNTFEYVLNSNNIPLLSVEKDYPSTQICSNCGNKQIIGKKKIYKCPVCGLSINRDDNASINLKNWYYSCYK